MKKTLILSLIFALSLAPTGVLRAQTAVSLTPEAQASLVADIQKQINDLMVQILLARIAELQAQITELIASQAQTQTQLGSVEQKVDSVVSQTAPVVVNVPVSNSIVVGAPVCKGTNPEIPLTISGSWESAQAHIILSDSWTMKQAWNYHSNPVWSNLPDNISGTFPVKIYLAKDNSAIASVPSINVSYLHEGTVILPSCQ